MQDILGRGLRRGPTWRPRTRRRERVEIEGWVGGKKIRNSNRMAPKVVNRQISGIRRAVKEMFDCFVTVVAMRATRQICPTDAMLICAKTGAVAGSKLRESGAIVAGNVGLRFVDIRRSGI